MMPFAYLLGQTRQTASSSGSNSYLNNSIAVNAFLM
jgi:hypothetical protein